MLTSSITNISIPSNVSMICCLTLTVSESSKSRRFKPRLQTLLIVSAFNCEDAVDVVPENMGFRPNLSANFFAVVVLPAPEYLA